MNKILLINLLNIIHKLFVYFLFLGFLLPKKYLYIHLLTLPLVKLHWILNDGNCFLTKYQQRLENKEPPKDTEYPFVRQMINDLGFYPKEKQIHIFFVVGTITAWLITFYRLFM